MAQKASKIVTSVPLPCTPEERDVSKILTADDHLADLAATVDGDTEVLRIQMWNTALEIKDSFLFLMNQNLKGTLN